MEGDVKVFTFRHALLRWVLALAVAWLFMFLVPGQWFINWYLPMSFFLLMGTVTFGIIGGGWPFGAPGGSWRPGKSRVLAGIGMVAVWIVAALVLTGIETWLWPGISPLAHPSGVPTGVWFGIGVFTVTLWYMFDGINVQPFKKAWANWALATGVILVLAGFLWWIFVNYNVPPTEAETYNPGGRLFGGDWFALCVWIIVYIEMFGSTMTFQGWPFYKAGKVLHPILLTLFVVVAGVVTWKWIMPGLFPDSTTFTWGAIGASIIGWQFMHSLAFDLYPFGRFKQPLRGVANLVLELVCVVAWIALIRYVLGPPLLNHINSAFPEPAADINTITAFITLHALAIVLLVHHFFFLRAPWSPPGPPLGPEEIQA